MSLKRYITVLDMSGDTPVRQLGSGSLYPVDGRLTNRNALLRAQDWAKCYAERKNIKRYLIVLFNIGTLSGTWYYNAHLPVSSDACIPAIERALN